MTAATRGTPIVFDWLSPEWGDDDCRTGSGRERRESLGLMASFTAPRASESLRK